MPFFCTDHYTLRKQMIFIAKNSIIFVGSSNELGLSHQGNNINLRQKCLIFLGDQNSSSSLSSEQKPQEGRHLFPRCCILASSFPSSKSFASKRCDSAAFLLSKGHHIIRQSSERPRRDLKKSNLSYN